MPFQLPTFNLTCNVWHNGGAAPPVGAPDIGALQCQLTWGPQHNMLVAGLPNTVTHYMLIKVPALTDLRGKFSSSAQDVVECPAGSTRYYVCMHVDDVAKGFTNEYRQGVMYMVETPTPMP